MSKRDEISKFLLLMEPANPKAATELRALLAKPEPFLCRYCLDEIVKDEDEACPECRANEAEYLFG